MENNMEKVSLKRKVLLDKEYGKMEKESDGSIKINRISLKENLLIKLNKVISSQIVILINKQENSKILHD